MGVRLFGEQFHRVRPRTFSPDTSGDSARMSRNSRDQPVQWPPAFVTVMPMLYIWGWTLPVWKQGIICWKDISTPKTFSSLS